MICKQEASELTTALYLPKFIDLYQQHRQFVALRD